jgi:hypothetical protein
MPTHRGGEYLGTVYYNIPFNASPGDSLRIRTLDNGKITERGFSRKTPVSNDGNIKLSSSGIVLNGAYPVNKKVELFWTGFVNYRYGVFQGAYRYPKSKAQVNTELWPDGFKSEALVNSRDISVIAGGRGQTNKGWNWEWNSKYGENSNEQTGRNTIMQASFIWVQLLQLNFIVAHLLSGQQINSISFAKDLAETTR